MEAGYVFGLGISYLLIKVILDNLPTKYSLKKIKKSGVLKTPINCSDVRHLSLEECLKFGENNEIIKDFYTLLEQKLGHCDLSAFYTNMGTLRIKSSNDSFLFKLLDALTGTRTGGAYLPKHNSIHVDEEPFGRSTLKRHIMTHELLHMASTRKDKDFTYSGFHIRGKKIEIGEGINEGYTELLNGRYFAAARTNDSYYDLQMLAVGIEDIVGQENMEEMYFSNDLSGLVERIGKYCSKDEAIELISKMDSLLKKKTRTDTRKSKELYNEIIMDIATIRYRKLEYDKRNEFITEREFLDGVYSLDLYINGYCSFDSKSGKMIAKGPLLKFGFIDMSANDYNEWADNYYSDFIKHGLYGTGEWKNKFGITSSKMIETRFAAKRQEEFKNFRRKYSVGRNGNFELSEMFDVQDTPIKPSIKK